MALIRTIVGVENVIRNIRKTKSRLASGVEKGVKRAGLYLLAESQKLVPVDTGNLKASGVMRATGKGFNTNANVAYTAAYALFVHENTEMKLKGQPRPGGRGHYWDPQGRGRSKFLEYPARTLAPKLRQIIRDSARIT